ncbi:MAG: hypothetical protein RI945_260 [Candidatus Parcubacteria bacterium]|jgi:peptidoglycan hydrolase-like protein with peptidoglycan-binding domain
MKKNFLTFALLTSVFAFLFFVSINFSLAQTTTPNMDVQTTDFSDVGKLINNFNKNIVQNLVALLSAAALVLFLWGLVRFIYDRAHGNDKNLEKDKEGIFWGLVALFVLVSVWGIIKMFQGLIGVSGDNNINLPKICINGNCDTGSKSPASSGFGGFNEGVNGGFNDLTRKLSTSSTTATTTNNQNIIFNDGTCDESRVRKFSVLKSGSGPSQEVADFQQCMRDRGIYLEIDGKFGPDTVNALRTFQSRNALVPDGALGPSTKAVILYRYLKATPTRDDFGVAGWGSDLALGAKSDDVISLQELLIDNGCYLPTAKNNTADGEFGKDTLDAVHNYQDLNFLREDGIVGPSTRAVMTDENTYSCK